MKRSPKNTTRGIVTIDREFFLTRTKYVAPMYAATVRRLPEFHRSHLVVLMRALVS
jgi:hypothetical protein